MALPSRGKHKFVGPITIIDEGMKNTKIPEAGQNRTTADWLDQVQRPID
jgi:hypothetical protein